jgi:uncharacterized phiE125 gp8 family phage protein
MMAEETAEPIVTMAEAQAYARIESGEEEGLLAGLVRSASGLCEAFLGQVVIARPFNERVQAGSDWQRLRVAPVRSIEAVTADGVAFPATAYSTDIDSSGCGWVRLTNASISGVVEVSGTAGIATGQNGVPEPIRQGVLRLVAHLFSSRDGQGGEVPAAVTALWRPYRRMRLV